MLFVDDLCIVPLPKHDIAVFSASVRLALTEYIVTTAVVVKTTEMVDEADSTKELVTAIDWAREVAA